MLLKNFPDLNFEVQKIPEKYFLCAAGCNKANLQFWLCYEALEIIKNGFLGENLISFDGSFNKYLNVIINDKLENLTIMSIELKELPTLPESLKVLNCNSNNMKNIIITDNILELYCDYCLLLEEIKFNDKLEILSCDHNLINNLDNLPESIIEVSCKYTKLTQFNNIPNNLKYLNITGNQFSDEDICNLDLHIFHFEF